MERLTKNVLTETSPMYELGEWADNEEALDKLGKLEDIEEELGIDLITLFKALKNGFWSIDKNKHIYKMKRTKGNGGAMMFYVSIDCIIKEDAYDEEYFLLKDYGKTWALTRKELEK